MNTYSWRELRRPPRLAIGLTSAIASTAAAIVLGVLLLDPVVSGLGSPALLAWAAIWAGTSLALAAEVARAQQRSERPNAPPAAVREAEDILRRHGTGTADAQAAVSAAEELLHRAWLARHHEAR